MPKTMPAEKKTYKLAGNAKQLDVNTGRGTIKVTNDALKSDRFVSALQKMAPKVFIKGLIVVS